MTPDEHRSIKRLLALANNDVIFNHELVLLFATLRETYGLAALLRMIEEHCCDQTKA